MNATSPTDSSKWTEDYWTEQAKYYIVGAAGPGQLGQHTQLLVLEAITEDFHARTGDWLLVNAEEVEQIDNQRQNALAELVTAPPKLRIVPEAIT